MHEYAVAPSVIDGITAHARRDFPHECCGLLIGSGRQVVAFHEAANTAAEPASRYTIDAADHFAAIRRARLDGLEVVGAYHSHPATAASPSATDRAEAFPHFLFVIVSLAEEAPAVTGWDFRGGNFSLARLVRTG